MSAAVQPAPAPYGPTASQLELAYSVLLGWRFGRAHMMLAPLLYPTIHLGLGAGFLSELIQPARKGVKTAAEKQRSSSAEDPQVLEGS